MNADANIRIHTLTCARWWWCVVCVYEPQPHSTRAGAHTHPTHTQHTRTINAARMHEVHINTHASIHTHTHNHYSETLPQTTTTSPHPQHNITYRLRFEYAHRHTRTHTYTLTWHHNITQLCHSPKTQIQHNSAPTCSYRLRFRYTAVNGSRDLRVHYSNWSQKPALLRAKR